ncbi:MAG TPA: MCE family protein [Streptosporangiaceae bacterium]|jgi:virulence factor Mce-like protein
MGRSGAVNRAIVFVVVIAVLLAGSVWWLVRGIGDRRITAIYPEAIGLYSGATVDVLGVEVGSVDSVRPIGRNVEVVMRVDRSVKVPEGVHAVVVEPSVVAGRFVQLTPAYTKGPQIEEDATIPVTRTATPVEVDQLYDSLTTLSNSLGPNGANKKGAFSDLISTGAANLRNNGKPLGTMIREFGKATRTLTHSQSDLFGTVDNLQSFTSMLKTNDRNVRSAEGQLAKVSRFLSADRRDLASALRELASALGQVQRFIRNNRGHIRTNVKKLASITRLLVNERRSLAEALDDVPLAVDNVLNTYDPTTGSLVGRGDLNEIEPPAGGN